MPRAKICVLTLYSGENEFEQCERSVKEQIFSEHTHVVFSHLGNVEGHRRLYNYIMDHASIHDIFIKLDADMIISRRTAFLEISEFFMNNRDLDEVEVDVYDHFTGLFLPGIHCFSSRARWPGLDKVDNLFIDAAPVIQGYRLRNPPEIPPFIDHAPDPSDFQAFHFGYHRALKAYQPGRFLKMPKQTLRQLRVLEAISRRYAQTKGRGPKLALLAANLVRQGHLRGISGDKLDRNALLMFDYAINSENINSFHNIHFTRNSFAKANVIFALLYSYFWELRRFF